MKTHYDRIRGKSSSYKCEPPPDWEFFEPVVEPVIVSPTQAALDVVEGTVAVAEAPVGLVAAAPIQETMTREAVVILPPTETEAESYETGGDYEFGADI